MAQCNWDPAKHNGKPCPVHGASGTENNTGHKLRINGGKYQVKYSDSSDYEDTDKETYEHLRETASQDFDENIEDDFGFDEEKGFEVYKDKIKEEIEKVKTKEDAEYVSDLIDDNMEAGYISEEMADELYNELDKKIDESSNNVSYKVGDEVTLEDGSKAKITKDYGEGNFEVLADDGYKYHYDSSDFEMYKNRTKKEDERIGREKVEGDVLFGRDMPSNDMDPYERPAEGVEFDEESSPMNEFSGPDREGPSYAQLDAKTEKIAKNIENYVSKDSLNRIKRYCDRYGVDYDYAINELARDINAGALENDTEFETVEKLLDNMVYTKSQDKERPIASQSEAESDKPQTRVKPEDFEDARFYPTASRMDGVRWVGRYHSIHDAFNGDNKDDFGDGKFKSVGDYKGASIYQLPDGYYSINPRITSMSFKTREALENYLDHEYDDDYRTYDFNDKGYQEFRKTKDGFDEESPDAYKRARSKKAINNTPAEFSQLKAKMPNGKEMSLFDFAHNIVNYLDNDTAATIIANKFGVSEKDALAYLETPYNKEGSKEDYENKLKKSY